MRARPKSARAASRFRAFASRGASVATTIRHEPWPARRGSFPGSSGAAAKSWRPSSFPTGTPSIVKTPPKFAWTRTPRTWPPGTTAGRGADATLPSKRLRTRARPHRAFVHGPLASVADGPEHVFARDRQRADVVQAPAVVGLAHHRVHRADLFIARLRERPAHDRVHRGSHRQGIGEDDGGLDRAELLHLRGARELPERIAHEHRTRHLVLEQVAAVGQHGRDAGAHALAFDERHLADPHTRHVGDGVLRTGREDAGGEAQVARPRPRLVGPGGGGQENQKRRGELKSRSL